MREREFVTVNRESIVGLRIHTTGRVGWGLFSESARENTTPLARFTSKQNPYNIFQAQWITPRLEAKPNEDFCLLPDLHYLQL